MTTPTQTQKRTSPYDSMIKYMSKALQNREAFYEGIDEATREFGVKNTPYTHATSPEAARQIFRGSPRGKEFISDNQWHMKQAMMFGVASIAHSLLCLVGEVRAIRVMMQEQRAQVPAQRSGRG